LSFCSSVSISIFVVVTTVYLYKTHACVSWL
jgi:hypothetical protein